MTDVTTADDSAASGGFGTCLLVPEGLAAPDDATAISENVHRAS